MGTATNAQICYGIPFDEDFEFPWGEDIEEWWLEKQGYQPPFQLYDTEGNYLNGREPSREEVTTYYKHMRDFQEAHPLPVELVNSCSLDCPSWIMAVPGSSLVAGRGCPVRIPLSGFEVEPEAEAALLAFCEEHGIEVAESPDWFLSSYWG